MKLGYARVSTSEQNLDLQMETLKAAGCLKILSEKVSGAEKERPELLRLLEQLRPSDVLVVWKLDRLARSTRDLLAIVDRLTQIEVGFQSLSEPWADTTSPAGRMMMTVFAGLAEFERALILERSAAGRKAAMFRGVRFGRKPSLSADQKALARRLLDEGTGPGEVAQMFGVHPSTVYRSVGKVEFGRPVTMLEKK